MAFLRSRLSKIFGHDHNSTEITTDTGNEDLQSDARKDPDCSIVDTTNTKGDLVRRLSTFIHDQPKSMNESGRIQAPDPSVGETSPNKRSLHKSASSTFKMLSDTIRSKTQTFYMRPSKVEMPSESNGATGRSKSQRPSILSNHQRRESDRSKVQGGLEELGIDAARSFDMEFVGPPELDSSRIVDPSTEEASEHPSSYISHQLQVKVPPTSTADLQNCTPVRQSLKGCGEPASLQDLHRGTSNLWPSPTNDALEQPFQEGFTSINRSPASIPEDPYVEGNNPWPSIASNTITEANTASALKFRCGPEGVSMKGKKKVDNFSPRFLPLSYSPRSSVDRTVAESRPEKASSWSKDLVPTLQVPETLQYHGTMKRHMNLSSESDVTVNTSSPSSGVSTLQKGPNTLRGPFMQRTISLKRGLSELLVHDRSILLANDKHEERHLPSNEDEADVEYETKASDSLSTRSRQAIQVECIYRYPNVQEIKAETESDAESNAGLELIKFPRYTETTKDSTTCYPPEALPTEYGADLQKVQFESLNLTTEQKNDRFSGIPTGRSNNNPFLVDHVIDLPVEAVEGPCSIYPIGPVDEGSLTVDEMSLDSIEICQRQDDNLLDLAHDSTIKSHLSLEYAVEAIDRPSGFDLDDSLRELPHLKLYRLYLEATCEKLLAESNRDIHRQLLVEGNSRAHLGDDKTMRQNSLVLPETVSIKSAFHHTSHKRLNDSESKIEGSRRFDHQRTTSSQSVLTTDSCAVTTHSPLCYVSPPFPSIHIRNTPVRRTSSINAEVFHTLNQKDFKESSPASRNLSGSIFEYSLVSSSPSPTEKQKGMPSSSKKAYWMPLDVVTSRNAGDASPYKVNIVPRDECSDSLNKDPFTLPPSIIDINDMQSSISPTAFIDKSYTWKAIHEGDITPISYQQSAHSEVWEDIELINFSGPNEVSSSFGELPPLPSCSGTPYIIPRKYGQRAIAACTKDFDLIDQESETLHTLISPMTQCRSRFGNKTSYRTLQSPWNSMSPTQHNDNNRDFIAAMLPMFKSSDVLVLQHCCEPTPCFEVLTPLDRQSRLVNGVDEMTGSTHGRKRSWQTSSVKKGVWWTRNAETLVLRNNDDSDDDDDVEMNSSKRPKVNPELHSQAAREGSPDDIFFEKMRTLWYAGNHAAGKGRSSDSITSSALEEEKYVDTLMDFLSATFSAEEGSVGPYENFDDGPNEQDSGKSKTLWVV
ncbi:hypothetical protein MMC06_006619 [Schaereria dolodes]|nr:hypothetical protein [Schaereria dolodes]